MIDRLGASRLKRLEFGVFAKCLGITAITAICVSLALSWSNLQFATKVAVNGVSTLAENVNSGASAALGGAIRFGNVAEIEQRIDVMMANNEGFVTRAVVLNAAGDVIFQRTPDGQADTELIASAQNALSNPSTTLHPKTDGFYVAERVMLGEGDTPVGVVATFWTPAQKVALIQREAMLSLGAALLFLIALLGGGWYLLRRFVGVPLQAINSEVQAVANGDFDVAVSGAGRRDEFGALSLNLQEMLNGLRAAQDATDARLKEQAETQKVMETISGALRQLARGNLDVRVTTPFPANFVPLQEDFNRTCEIISQTIRSVVATAAEIDNETVDINAQSTDLSHRTENQAATLEEAAAALDQLTRSVQDVANDARSADEIVRRTQEEARESSDVVKEAVSAMAEIEKSSEQISKIISVIDDIAFQTNLLALNAGVEAARAGEEGRGFAVVASEVRALAQRSSEAAHEIKTLIRGSSDHVGRGVQLVDRTGMALSAISERVSESAQIIAKMAEGAQDQSKSLEEINSSVSELDRNTQHNAAMVVRANTAVKSLQQQAHGLSRAVAQFDATANEGMQGDGRAVA